MILDWLYQRLFVDALGIVYGLILLIIVSIWLRRRRQSALLKSRPKTKPKPAPKTKIQAEGFQRKILCNRLEQSAFFVLQQLVQQRHQGEIVLVQVSMGEVLQNQNYREFLSINSKRLDLLVISAKFEPLLAIEIDGSGHFLNENSHKNDQIKTKALQAAGIHILRIDAPNDDLKRIEKDVRAGAERFFARYDKIKNK